MDRSCKVFERPRSVFKDTAYVAQPSLMCAMAKPHGTMTAVSGSGMIKYPFSQSATLLPSLPKEEEKTQ